MPQSCQTNPNQNGTDVPKLPRHELRPHLQTDGNEMLLKDDFLTCPARVHYCADGGLSQVHPMDCRYCQDGGNVALCDSNA
jgi:hypothetical protein